MTCVDLNIFGAIHTWALGQKLDGMCVHGLNVVWLSRAAKLLAFFSAGTLLIDIVGPRRAVAWAVVVRRRLSRIGPKAEAIGNLLVMRGKLHPSITRSHIVALKNILLGLFAITVAFSAPEIWADIKLGFSSGEAGQAAKSVMGRLFIAYIIMNFVVLFAGAAAFAITVIAVVLSQRMLQRDFCERARVVAGIGLCIAFGVDMLTS